MLAMCALLVCLFVISASATDAIYMVEFKTSSENLCGEIYDTCFDDTNFSIKSSGDGSFWIIRNIEGFQSFVNNMDYDSFYELCQSRYNSCGHDFYFRLTESTYRFEQCFDYFVNYGKNEITQEDLAVQYNQGKIDGVTEYKESEEYSSTLQSEYTKGYGEGFEAYKDSAEYESALNTQFNLGSSTGVKNYLESEEYSNALQNEYDNGYEAATTEDNQKGAKNMLGTALGISGALIIVLLCVYFFVGRKAKKRR